MAMRTGAMRAMATRRHSVARQTGWAMAAVVVLAVLVSALITAGLVGSHARAETRHSLVLQADQAAAVLDAADPNDVSTTLQVLRRQRTPTAWRAANGVVRGAALARQAYGRLGQPQPSRAASRQTRVDGRLVLVELRPLSRNRVLVMAREVTTFGPEAGFLWRMLAGLVAGLLVAGLAAWWLSRRISGPLRDTAEVAQRLAAGERGVEVPVDGPREVAEVGESVNALAASLERSEGRQREFLMSVSHELRTPLTAIRGFGEALADGVTMGEQARRAGETILAEAGRLERLVGDLLELARVGAVDFSVDVAPVDLRELVEAAAAVWAERARAAGVDFRLEVPDPAYGPVVAPTDPVRLRQVVDGLAENALRVTPAGRPLVLALGVEGPSGADGACLVEVRDGGPGLSEEDREVAFERGALHDRYRGVRRVGTGLGLALVKALVDGLGATITVEPAPLEGGTAFTVRLPRDP
ncbi:Sensor protein [Nostocoides japonicum T1-X7]|uniref:Signal transduction histidine-protein kinase/phosphatase MprB n=1 Tax=Nostocoides japonicum T1-X7 TaxID=1194083 RepID=A0A077LW58_9MICO|nr:Sensor protein [Tetrasphaera japonica T1-X7]